MRPIRRDATSESLGLMRIGQLAIVTDGPSGQDRASSPGADDDDILQELPSSSDSAETSARTKVSLEKLSASTTTAIARESPVAKAASLVRNVADIAATWDLAGPAVLSPLYPVIRPLSSRTRVIVLRTIGSVNSIV